MKEDMFYGLTLLFLIGAAGSLLGFDGALLCEIGAGGVMAIFVVGCIVVFVLSLTALVAYMRNLHIQTEREDDGRWIAEDTSKPGAMAYGTTEAEAVAALNQSDSERE